MALALASAHYAWQFIIMIARAESVGPLAPLGLIFMTVLAALTTIPACIGGWARRRWEQSGR
jgi:hypothetical protein